MSMNLEKIWDRIWKGDSYSQSNLRMLKAEQKIDLFKDKLSVNKSSVCVDLGCGGGYITNSFYQYFGCRMMGIDFSKMAIESAVQRFGSRDGKCDFKLGSATQIPLPDESADIVLCIGVLEHVPDIEAAMQEIKRILRPKGQLVVFSSNRYSLMYWDRLLKQKLGIWRYGYQKNWSPSEFQAMAESAGIAIEHSQIVQGIGDFPTKNFLDNMIHAFYSSWGRYFLMIGRR